MGEYLNSLNKVIDKIYKKQINEAKSELQKLLNVINADMIASNNPQEKQRAKMAITKLLPALNDLKLGKVSDNVINIFSLDRSRLNESNVSFDDFFKSIEKEKPSQNKKKEDDFIIDCDDLIFNNISEVNEEPKEKTLVNNKSTSKLKKSLMQNKKPLSPLLLDDYIGQEQAKKAIKIAIKAAKKEGRVLEHLLICSSYGLGKTTLANIIANEMDLPFFNVNATNLKDTKSLSLYFSKIEESCIIFIDEIHSLKKDVQTVLLSILTDYQVNMIDTDGEEQCYQLPPFTLIGATTQAGELLKPFINRFSILELVDYTDNEKEVIVRSKFSKLGYEITDDAVTTIAKRSRGVPRTIENFAKGIRDLAINNDVNTVDLSIANEYFDMNNIDELGLLKNDLKLLEVLASTDSPIGIVTLESKLGIQREDLEFRYEPYLIKLGLIEKTDRGRVITKSGREYLTKSEN